MSENEKIYERINNAINEDRVYQQKEKELKQAKIDYQYSTKIEIEREKIAAQSLNLDDLGEGYIDSLVSNLDEYFENCGKQKIFINDSFRGIVPFFRRNVILVGAMTGSGKSTTTANIALGTILQGENCLVLTNEEVPEDVYGRVVALIKGWAYTKHENFTDEQKATTKEYMKKLSQRLHVIGPHSLIGRGIREATTSLEGIKDVLESVLRNGNKYGCIIFDYYQNVNICKTVPNTSQNDISERFYRYLDQYKNVFDAPIVVMSQLMPSGKKDNPLPFRDRIEGRKGIINVCTVAIELRANREHGLSEFIIHKSRFNEFQGKAVTCGFDKGKFVKNDAAFQAKRDKSLIDSLKKEDKDVGVPSDD